MPKLEIFDNSLIKLIVRKGPNSDRVGAVLAEGEPGYTVDTKRLFIGDNTTPGGNVVGNKFLGYATDLTTLPTVPGVIGDIAYNPSLSTLYYIQTGGGTITTDWVPISTNIDTVSYNSLYSLVQSTSARQAAGYTVTTSISTRANSVYSLVNSKSSNWDTSYSLISSILPINYIQYFNVLTVPGTITIGDNDTDNIFGGIGVIPIDNMTVTDVVVTCARGPITGALVVQCLVNTAPVSTVFVLSGNRTGTSSLPVPFTVTTGDAVSLFVTTASSGISGLNVYFKGTVPS